MMGVGAKRAIGLYRSCAPRQQVCAKWGAGADRGPYGSGKESQLATSLKGRDESANKRQNRAGMVSADRRLIKFGARLDRLRSGVKEALEVEAPPGKAPFVLQRIVLVVLLACCLTLPSNWTQNIRNDTASDTPDSNTGGSTQTSTRPRRPMNPRGATATSSTVTLLKPLRGMSS